jgi:hypothetical protein
MSAFSDMKKMGKKPHKNKEKYLNQYSKLETGVI